MIATRVEKPRRRGRSARRWRTGRPGLRSRARRRAGRVTSWVRSSGVLLRRVETEPERREPAVDAHAGGLRGGVERVGEFFIGKVVDVAQSDRVELTLGKLREGLVQTLEPRPVGVCGGRLALEAVADAEARARGPLEPPAANRCGQDMARDGEEPRTGGTACLIAETSSARATPARTSRPSGRARRSRPATAEMEPVHPLRVAVVQQPERPGIRARGADEVCVGRHRSHERVVIATSRSFSERWREGPTMLRGVSSALRPCVVGCAARHECRYFAARRVGPARVRLSEVRRKRLTAKKSVLVSHRAARGRAGARCGRLRRGRWRWRSGGASVVVLYGDRVRGRRGSGLHPRLGLPAPGLVAHADRADRRCDQVPAAAAGLEGRRLQHRLPVVRRRDGAGRQVGLGQVLGERQRVRGERRRHRRHRDVQLRVRARSISRS